VRKFDKNEEFEEPNSLRKFTASVFWDILGATHFNFLLNRAVINGYYLSPLLERVRESISMTRPKLLQGVIPEKGMSEYVRTFKTQKVLEETGWLMGGRKFQNDGQNILQFLPRPHDHLIEVGVGRTSKGHLACSHLLTLVPCSRNFFSSTLKMEAIRSSETSVYTISTWRHILEDGIIHSHRRENLKSYTF
jgi:hypothetical protein